MTGVSRVARPQSLSICVITLVLISLATDGYIRAMDLDGAPVAPVAPNASLLEGRRLTAAKGAGSSAVVSNMPTSDVGQLDDAGIFPQRIAILHIGMITNLTLAIGSCSIYAVLLIAKHKHARRLFTGDTGAATTRERELIMGSVPWFASPSAPVLRAYLREYLLHFESAAGLGSAVNPDQFRAQTSRAFVVE